MKEPPSTNPWAKKPVGFSFSETMTTVMASQKRKSLGSTPWQGREFPVLDERRCSGCALCCAVCPTDCLEMQGALPWMPRPAQCISSGVCVLVCPTGALEMAAFEPETPNADDLA